MIELKVDKFAEGIVIFHIERQDVEDYERLREERYFCLDNGKIYSLQSYSHTELVEGKRLFVRGSYHEIDNNLLTTSLDDYLNICECVKKYNENKMIPILDL